MLSELHSFYKNYNVKIRFNDVNYIDGMKVTMLFNEYLKKLPNKENLIINNKYFSFLELRGSYKDFGGWYADKTICIYLYETVDEKLQLKSFDLLIKNLLHEIAHSLLDYRSNNLDNLLLLDTHKKLMSHFGFIPLSDYTEKAKNLDKTFIIDNKKNKITYVRNKKGIFGQYTISPYGKKNFEEDFCEMFSYFLTEKESLLCPCLYLLEFNELEIKKTNKYIYEKVIKSKTEFMRYFINNFVII